MELTNYNKKNKTDRRKALPAPADLLYGKVPPQAKEIEQAVLGAIMLEKTAFDTVVEILKPESFYVEAHKIIFRAMQQLAIKSMEIDLLTVVEQLKFTEELEIVGGPYYITTLTNSVVSGANIEGHSRIIAQKFIKRELIRIGGEIVQSGYDETVDCFDALDQSDISLSEIVNGNTSQQYISIDTSLVKTIQRIENLKNNADGSGITGVPTGFFSLDKVTAGWQPQDLIILAARPSVGKTAFALNLALNASTHVTKGVPVGFFSLEMSHDQLTQRMLSIESEIWIEKITRGQLNDAEMKQLYAKGVRRLSKVPIFIDDSASLTIFDIRAKARRMKNKHNVGLIIIDYLQLMSGTDGKNGNREQEVSKISRELKKLAKELKIPIIALSQLSRETEKRSGDKKMPQLSDLRESGAIEQDADTVMFLFRPEYYGFNSNEMGESNKGETLLSINKHRHGAIAIGNDAIRLKALLHIQKFKDWDDMDAHKEDILGGSGGNWKPVSGLEKDNGDGLFD